MDGKIQSVAVVVPARDEAALICPCLDSLIAARAEVAVTHPAVDVTIVVVADACADATEEIVRSYGDRGVDLAVVRVGRVGVARGIGIRRSLSSGDGPALRSAWIANTDADSVVPALWLTHQVELADAGADVMVGTVRPDPADLTADQWARWTATHERGRPNGHVHGANLGVRASAYEAVSGFDPVAEHEDNLLVARLRERGAVIVASDVAEVVTSGRPVGRTPGGYAAHLVEALSDSREPGLEPQAAP
ncbi:glycosyl transferase family 2 [Frondihabitans australicus]|uniref:4,4'-diaponeurosporenoate glycosyltransferase n=2 Tax=Frondihabitans australicus TaxID=386892 RepID=A0A495IIA5_9MICO|nr:glycosyl transferase family 2 [Frondihabitans australicus]